MPYVVSPLPACPSAAGSASEQRDAVDGKGERAAATLAHPQAVEEQPAVDHDAVVGPEPGALGALRARDHLRRGAPPASVRQLNRIRAGSGCAPVSRALVLLTSVEPLTRSSAALTRPMNVSLKVKNVVVPSAARPGRSSPDSGME